MSLVDFHALSRASVRIAMSLFLFSGIATQAGRSGAMPLLNGQSRPTMSPAATVTTRTREINSSALIGITNGQVTLTFDRHTGALVSLHNEHSKDEYLKHPGGEGNPFRVYVDTTQPPAPAVDPGWWGGKIEGAMGGQIVDASDCHLLSSAFKRSGNAGVLTLTLRQTSLALRFALQILVADGDNTADCTLTVYNDNDKPHTFLTAFPHLTGLQLGDQAETNLGLMLASYGTPGVRAWMDTGGFYGREVTMQWQAVYEPRRNEGFGFLIMDPELKPKLIRRFAPSGMSTLYLPSLRLAPGESHRYPTARLIVHKGNWRVVARRYGEWFRKHFKPRRSPDWLKDVDLFVGTWIPDAASVIKAKESGSKEGFRSYRQMPRLYLNDSYDLKEWAMYNEGVRTNPATYGPYMADGTYYLRSDLDGVGAMREGITRLHQIGRRAMFYVAGNSILKDSDVLKGTNMNDWMLMDQPGHMYDIGYPNGMSVCPGYIPWQDHLARTCKRLLQETGADGIRLDELASFVPCYNPAHHHTSSFESNQWMRELCRKVRAAMDEVNRNTILNTEGPIDYLHESCDASLQMFQPGRDIDAMRVAIPSYVGLAYHPGAVEAALNGWVGGKTTTRRVEWPWAHRGLSGRPSSYQEGAGPEVHWQELRASFPEAIMQGQVTLEDPQAIGAPHWVGRLWQGQHYWLLVGGNEDGTSLAGETRITLPELPSQIKYACELDAATLTIRDAKLTWEKGQASLTVHSGFSAVLLPLPDCPPLLQMQEDTLTLKRGEKRDVDITLFAPWKTSKESVAISASLPGLNVAVSRLTVPGRIQIRVPKDAEPGLYPLRLTGKCLPLKRWVRVIP